MRIILGYVLAPFPAALIQAIFVALWPKIDMGGVFAHPASMFVAICLLFYLLQATTGVGSIVFMRRRMLTARRAYVYAGLVAITLPIAIAIIWAAIRDQLPISAMIYNLAFFAAGGALAGLVFWTTAVRPRGIKAH